MRKSTLVWRVVPDMKGSLKGPLRLTRRTNETILLLKLKLKPSGHKKCMTLLVTKTESQIVIGRRQLTTTTYLSGIVSFRICPHNNYEGKFVIITKNSEEINTSLVCGSRHERVLKRTLSAGPQNK